MSRVAKWTTCVSIAFIVLLAGAWWYSVHVYTNKHLIEAAGLVDQFHREYNEHDFDAICHITYKCEESHDSRAGYQAVLEDTRADGGAFKHVLRSNISSSL